MQIISDLIEAHIFTETPDGLKFLLLKRSDTIKYPGVWQMVTGRIEEGEKAYETAIREIKEETGFQIERLWAVPNINSFYSSENDHICLIPVFAALVSGVNKVKLCEEHCEYKWIKAEEAVELFAWPGQKKSVKIINEYFTGKKNYLNFIEII